MIPGLRPLSWLSYSRPMWTGSLRARPWTTAVTLENNLGFSAEKNYSNSKNMLIEYIQKAIERASYKKLKDGTWFAEIHGFPGVWANGETVESCRRELWSVLEEWIVLKIRDGDTLPRIGGISLKIKGLKVG